MNNEKQRIRNKIVLPTLNETKPSKYFLSLINESRKNKKKKDYYSFKNTKEAIEFLK